MTCLKNPRRTLDKKVHQSAGNPQHPRLSHLQLSQRCHFANLRRNRAGETVAVIVAEDRNKKHRSVSTNQNCINELDKLDHIIQKVHDCNNRQIEGTTQTGFTQQIYQPSTRKKQRTYHWLGALLTLT
jgi:hypothetical protein